jgi:hypothetical protein
VSEGQSAVGKVKVAESLKTIKGICNLYSVHYFIDYGEEVAVYNCENDNYHFFRWSSDISRYIYNGCKDYMPDAMERRVGI